MKALVLAFLLSLVALSLCRGVGTNPKSKSKSRPPAAFMSRRDSAKALDKKQTANAAPNGKANAAQAALEPQREVCELNPACDELADHIGFKEAYRRFYGPI